MEPFGQNEPLESIDYNVTIESFDYTRPIESIECVATSDIIYHPIVLKIKAAQTACLLACNVILLAVLVRYLSRFDKQSVLNSHKNALKPTDKARKAPDFKTTFDSSFAMPEPQPSTSTGIYNTMSMVTTPSKVTRMFLTSQVSDINQGEHEDNQATTRRQHSDKSIKQRNKSWKSTSRRQARNSRTTRKSRVMLMMAATCFYSICYTPYIVTLTLYICCPSQGHCWVTPNHIKVTATLTVIHGLFNVVMYICKDNEFRNDMFRVLRINLNQVTPA